MNLLLQDIQELNQNNVHIKDKNEVMHKINSLIKGGCNNLQLVSDFDMTLTKQHDAGKKHLTSFGMIRKCPSMPEYYTVKELELYNKYRPIEIDPYLPHDEKLKHMQDWWRASENLLRGIKLPVSEFEEVARIYDPALRDGSAEMINDLYKVEVPVLIFSAGLGESVEAVLKHNKILLPNVKVVSNYLDFDEDFVIKGYKDRMITVLNKNEKVLEGTEYYNLVKNRGNVILMGDHIGDACMADGVPHTSTILKIGFLFDRVEECLPKYMSAFDIVLVDDQTMNVTKSILKLILNH